MVSGADAVGLSVVHVNRTLQLMRADGLISWRANHVIVHDRDALAGAAGFQADYLKLNGIV
jgi:hypothetical protein